MELRHPNLPPFSPYSPRRPDPLSLGAATMAADPHRPQLLHLGFRGDSTRSVPPDPSISRLGAATMATDTHRLRPLHIGQRGSRPATRCRPSGNRQGLLLCPRSHVPPCTSGGSGGQTLLPLRPSGCRGSSFTLPHRPRLDFFHCMKCSCCLGMRLSEHKCGEESNLM